MRKIDVYDEELSISDKNARALRCLSAECGIEEAVLGTIWGYISQAIIDEHDITDRVMHNYRRCSVEAIFRKYDFLLGLSVGVLYKVAEMLPEIGCRAATPETLESELRNELG